MIMMILGRWWWDDDDYPSLTRRLLLLQTMPQETPFSSTMLLIMHRSRTDFSLLYIQWQKSWILAIIATPSQWILLFSHPAPHRHRMCVKVYKISREERKLREWNYKISKHSLRHHSPHWLSSLAQHSIKDNVNVLYCAVSFVVYWCDQYIDQRSHQMLCQDISHSFSAPHSPIESSPQKWWPHI